MSLFFELLQVALGTRTELSKIPNTNEWRAIFDEAQRQAVVGVMVDGLERLPNVQRPAKLILLQWVGQEQMIAQTYKLHYERALELQSCFRGSGFDFCVLKGLGLAQMYPNPQRRQLGDIDIWVRPRGENSIKKIIEYLQNKYNIDRQKIVYHHVDVPIFYDVEVEVHWRPSWRSSLFYNNRIQKWFNAQAEVQFASGEKSELVVPTWDFNVIFLLQHMYMHIFMEGLGLRQFVDYYYLLMSKDRRPNNEIVRTLKYLGLYSFAGAVMYVMHEVFILDKQYLISQIDVKRGRNLLDDIMLSGNFGHYDKRNKSYFKNCGIEKSWIKIRKQLRFMRDYPSEALCVPFRFYHIIWRKFRMWRWE